MYAGEGLYTPEINVKVCRERFIHTRDKCLYILERALCTPEINVYVCW